MCGICAYFGENAVENVLEGLKKLEYRGYDSAGVAFFDENNSLEIVKSVGKIETLMPKVCGRVSDVAISHTRWATHGAVTEQNAHPQISSDGNFAIVHNGIVENFEALKNQHFFGVDFASQTDTEVLANLIAAQQGGALERLRKACEQVEGSFALAMLCLAEEGEAHEADAHEAEVCETNEINRRDAAQKARETQKAREAQKEQKVHQKESVQKTIYLAKRHSPLMVAFENGRGMAASDLSVFAGKFETCVILDDDEFATIDKSGLKIFDKNGKKIKKNAVKLKNFNFEDDFLCDCQHFMLKEINEQPAVLKRTAAKYFAEKVLSQKEIEILRKFESFCFVACGTAYHAALLGAGFLKEFCGKRAEACIASEFKYSNNIFCKNTLYVFVSQSGETADTLSCAQLVKKMGCNCMCVTNVPYCTLNKFADFVLPTFAGREVAVASTKAYSAQVFTLLVFALLLGGKESEIKALKNFVEKVKLQKIDEKIAQNVLKFEKIFFIGRQQDYVTALEGALKLKEVSYINCLAIAAGELKHGTLALVDEHTLVVAISTNEKLKNKLESNLLEVKARGGHLLLITSLLNGIQADFVIELPQFEQFLMPIVSAFTLQLLAYQCAVLLQHNPDKPRNLAKSVTVE